MKEKFIKALESNDLNGIRNIPKSDLHNHASRGGNINYISEDYKFTTKKTPKFKSLYEMNKWNSENIKPFIHGRTGYEKRIEAAFVQAKMDGVKVLDMCVDIGEVAEYDGSVEQMVEDYNVHPIKKLYHNGVKVTVNTDDMIIFDASVSDEFFNLYKSGALNAEELNEIRENGLNSYTV